MHGAFRQRKLVGPGPSRSWLFYEREAEGGGQVTVGKLRLAVGGAVFGGSAMGGAGVATIEHLEVYQGYRGRGYAKDMLADLEETLGTTAAHVRQLRLVALEDEARHGKLEALYRECGFARTSAAVRYESDTDFTYRLVPMFKRM